jgi:hypothetical protein
MGGVVHWIVCTWDIWNHHSSVAAFSHFGIYLRFGVLGLDFFGKIFAKTTPIIYFLAYILYIQPSYSSPIEELFF